VWRATAELRDLAYLSRKRRDEKRDDSRRWILTGGASGGDWRRRRWRLSPVVGRALVAPAAGAVGACGDVEGDCVKEML